jgi:hypothetical protein
MPCLLYHQWRVLWTLQIGGWVGSVPSLDTMEEILSPLSITWFLTCPACNLVTIPTELSWLLKLHHVIQNSNSVFVSLITPDDTVHNVEAIFHTDTLTFHGHNNTDCFRFWTTECHIPPNTRLNFFPTNSSSKILGWTGAYNGTRIKHVLRQGRMIFISQSKVNAANCTAVTVIIHSNNILYMT